MRLYMLAVFAAILPAEEWSRFRGPNGSGIGAGGGYPTEFSAKKNLAWRTPVRPGKSSPVLTEKHVFLTGFQDENLYTQCFNRATGKLLWERFEPRTRKVMANLLNHSAALTPVTDGDNVYVLFEEFGLLSYTSAGKLRWKVPIDPVVSLEGLGASPILAGDSVVIQIDHLQGSYIEPVPRRLSPINIGSEASSHPHESGRNGHFCQLRPDMIFEELQVLPEIRRRRWSPGIVTRVFSIEQFSVPEKQGNGTGSI